MARLEQALDERSAAGAAGFVLVGRADLRSNNSWMHNLTVLVKGKPRCTLQLHPDDAVRLGLESGASPRVLPDRRSDDPRRGDRRDHAGGREHPSRLGSRPRRRPASVAATTAAGVNSNLLADEMLFDPLSAMPCSTASPSRLPLGSFHRLFALHPRGIHRVVPLTVHRTVFVGCTRRNRGQGAARGADGGTRLRPVVGGQVLWGRPEGCRVQTFANGL